MTTRHIDDISGEILSRLRHDILYSTPNKISEICGHRISDAECIRH